MHSTKNLRMITIVQFEWRKHSATIPIRLDGGDPDIDPLSSLDSLLWIEHMLVGEVLERNGASNPIVQSHCHANTLAPTRVLLVLAGNK